jgi:solute carrier family 35, member E3
MKILCTPVIIFIEYYFYNKETSRNTILSLVTVCIGIFITVVTEMSMNFIGTVYAILAIASNSLYTIVRKKNKKSGEKQNKMNFKQMLYKYYCINR